MLTRIITSIVALAVFFVIIFAGAVPLQIAIGLVIAAMLYEMYGAVTKSAAVKTCGYICGALMAAGIYFSNINSGALDVPENINLIALSVILMIIVTMIFLIFLHGRVNYREIFSAVLITMYVTLFMSYIPMLQLAGGLPLMAFIFIIAWGSDTFAYFCGTFFGKHKLIPKVSPKKTVEGSVGALVCVMAVCMLYVLTLYKCGHPLRGVKPDFGTYFRIGIIGAVGAAISQLGDLAASAIKRDTGIKDYGKIFPGHGGFMDRFDSVIFIAPLVYYLCINII